MRAIKALAYTATVASPGRASRKHLQEPDVAVVEKSPPAAPDLATAVAAADPLHCAACNQTLKSQANMIRHLESKKHALASESALSTALAGLALTGSDDDNLDRLLHACSQPRITSLEDIFAGIKVRKLGEGTFAEVFSGGDRAFKIMPFGGTQLYNDEVQKRAVDLIPEVTASLHLNKLREKTNACFIEVFDVFVCRGAYPAALVAAWDAWRVGHDCQNDRPDSLDPAQLYAVFVFSNGGSDLETFPLDSLEQGVSIIRQVCVSLSLAEEALAFEHRDLHWGNLLIQPTDDARHIFHLADENGQLQMPSNGVKVSIIDFTLSRLVVASNVFYCDLEADDWLFKGKGDSQFDVYRKMRKACKKSWEEFTPKSNVFWLSYLAEKILAKCSVKRTSASTAQSKAAEAELHAFLHAAEVCDSATELWQDPFVKEHAQPCVVIVEK